MAFQVASLVTLACTGASIVSAISIFIGLRLTRPSDALSAFGEGVARGLSQERAR